MYKSCMLSVEETKHPAQHSNKDKTCVLKFNGCLCAQMKEENESYTSMSHENSAIY